jgi:hypothetical protein
VHEAVIAARQPDRRQPTKEDAVRMKLQLLVAVAAAVAVTALTMSALAVGQDQPTTTEAGATAAGTPKAVSTAGVGEAPPAFVTDCLTKAGITVPDGLDARGLKEWVSQHPDAMAALEKCAPPDSEDGVTTTVCKTGKPGVPAKAAEAMRARKRAQASSSSAR